MRGWPCRKKDAASRRSFFTVCRTPPAREAGSWGMRTAHAMSSADKTNSAPETATTGSIPNTPNTSPPSTGPTSPESMLTWLMTAVARWTCSRPTSDGTADCTVG